MCKQQKGGGYAANEVGQALAKLGFTQQAERKRFLQSVPGLQERGSGPTKVLVF